MATRDVRRESPEVTYELRMRAVELKRRACGHLWRWIDGAYPPIARRAEAENARIMRGAEAGVGDQDHAPKARPRNQPPAPTHSGLKNRIPKVMRSVQRSHALIRALFHHPPVAYAA